MLTRSHDRKLTQLRGDSMQPRSNAALGTNGQYKDRVYKFVVGRKTQKHDVEVGNQMGREYATLPAPSGPSTLKLPTSSRTKTAPR